MPPTRSTRSSTRTPRQRSPVKPYSRNSPVLETSTPRTIPLMGEESFSPISTPQINSLVSEHSGQVSYLDDDFTRLDSTALIIDGWSKSEQYLFDRIRRRTKFPMFPSEWALTFSGLPKALFSGEEELALFTPLRSNSRAQLMMEKLMNMGVSVRGKLDRGRSAQKAVWNTVKRYFDWAFWDCDLDPRQQPILWVSASATDIQTLESSMKKRLIKAALRARDFYTHRINNESILDIDPKEPQLPPPPTIFGIAVYECIVAIMTLNSEVDDLENSVRTHLVCDFSNHGLDVWNAIAVALAAVSLKEEAMDWKVFREHRAEKEGRPCSSHGYPKEAAEEDE